jgi:hypothetical protein
VSKTKFTFDDKVGPNLCPDDDAELDIDLDAIDEMMQQKL